MKPKISKGKPQAFTIVEILIVIAILAVLGTIAWGASIKSSLQKARDSKRKQDLNKLVRLFEDYYSDRLNYPQPNPGEGTISGVRWGDPFPQYNFILPGDPLSPSQQYYYESDTYKQYYFVIYAKLENTSDDDIETVGCIDGCGPNLAYNYVVHSSNVIMLAGLASVEAQGGGGDGGGGGVPIITNAPTGMMPFPTGPTPTLNLLPPPNCNSVCELNQCCRACWCGAANFNDGGEFCGNNFKCWMQTSPNKWLCAFEQQCPGA